MSAAAELERLAGHLIVGGFQGTALPDDMRLALEQGRRAGVILFSRNIEDVGSTHDLCRAVLAASAAEPPFISVDQEGGRVRRLRAPCIELPPMRVLGDQGDPDAIRAAAEAVGRELAAIGFNLDFAPVLDVDSNPDNPIIGDRAFARDAALVARFACAFAEGLHAAGLLSCGKHFPGHGDTELDSHLDLPTVRHDRATLMQREIVPFRAAAPVVPTLMSAHVVYEALDPGVPATLSSRIATDLLRRDIGFSGVLFSDDLEMRALSDRYSIEDSAVGAIEAGCDVLLVCSRFDLQERAHAALVRAAARDATFRARCEEAAHRSVSARRRAPPRPAASRDAVVAALGRYTFTVA